MLRKFLLVGAVVLVGRGTVAQIACATLCSFFFFALHVKMWPLKSDEDNTFRALAEIHVFFTITCAFIFKEDLTYETVPREVYDWCLFISFILFIPGGFVYAVLRKLYRAQANGILTPSAQSLSESVAKRREAFGRYQAGIASSSDRSLLSFYFSNIQNRSCLLYTSPSPRD